MNKNIKDYLEIELKKVIKKYSHKNIPNKNIAYLIREIRKRELRPGGPYKNNLGLVDKQINQTIYRFLKKINVNLPKLNSYLKIKTPQKMQRVQAPIKLNKKILTIISLTKRRLPDLSAKMRDTLIKAITKTAKGNLDEQMFLMPHFFYESLKIKNKSVSHKLLNELGLMNAFFWTSFIIYDDFWDKDEAAQEKLLPIANYLARHFYSFFDNIFRTNKEFYSFFISSLNKLDNANFFEITNCRKKRSIFFGDMKIKFYPSIGHIFGPLVILFKSGYSFKSIEVKETISFFKNYLIARQISDDMHDIEEDWQRGHLSLAVNELLLDAGNKDITDFKIRNNLFWTKTIDKLCYKSFSLLQNCRRSLMNNSCLKKTNILQQLCFNLESAAKMAQKERNKKLKFIKELFSS